MVAWANKELLPTLSIVDRDLFPEHWNRCSLASVVQNAKMQPFPNVNTVSIDSFVIGELTKIRHAVESKRCAPVGWALVHNGAMLYLSEAHARFEAATAIVA